jgi:hypothetical protein
LAWNFVDGRDGYAAKDKKSNVQSGRLAHRSCEKIAALPPALRPADCDGYHRHYVTSITDSHREKDRKYVWMV